MSVLVIGSMTLKPKWEWGILPYPSSLKLRCYVILYPAGQMFCPAQVLNPEEVTQIHSDSYREFTAVAAAELRCQKWWWKKS